jgi:hypothetical protein
VSEAAVGLGSSEVRAVCAAAESSLTAHGARVYTGTVREDSAGGWTQPWSWRIGVADPARRSTELKSFDSNESPLVKLAEAAAKRWPWFGDAGPTGEGPHAGGETIDIGRRYFYGGASAWMDWSDLAYYGPARPLWILEAMLGTVTAEPAGRCEVRGESCARYLAEVQPGQVAGRSGIELIDPPGAEDDWGKVAADVSIDAAGLIRRVMWSPTTGRRFKPGLIPRLLERFERQAPTEPLLPRVGGRPWTVLELWDYGCPVEINEPTELIEPGGTSFANIVRDVWRMRSDYKRRQQS